MILVFLMLVVLVGPMASELLAASMRILLAEAEAAGFTAGGCATT